MSEPTIDEMLAWLDSLTYDGYNNTPCNNAIRAILEQHRKVPLREWKGLMLVHPKDMERRELEAIRAFVERVAYRLTYDGVAILYEELAAMEKANAGTND